MDHKLLIEKLIKATSPVHVFEKLGDFKKQYEEYAKVIHPDRCSEPQAKEAFQKLNEYKRELEKGKIFTDEVGEITYFPRSIKVKGPEDLLKKSLKNYQALMSKNDPVAVQFKKYIPETGSIDADNILRFTFFRRAVPVVMLGTLDQKYVNFILSRMLEFAAWLNQNNYCHAGFNPDSVWTIPEDHGMQCCSFYHMKVLDDKLTTISAKYSQLYPSTVFRDKKASSIIDTTLAKRTAIYLLGDKSGTGNVLRKTHNAAFMSFVQKTHDDPVECFKEYRKMIEANFEKKFHILNV